MPLLYEDTNFKRGFADTEDITINPTTTTPPTGQVTVIVNDLITKAPIVNAQLTSGTNTATTDATGTANITLDTTMIIHISASWYLAKTITPTMSTTSVSLIPIWLIAAGAGGTALIVIGVAISSGRKAQQPINIYLTNPQPAIKGGTQK